MYKILFALLYLSTALFGRENPFFPVNASDDIAVTSNIVQKTAPLKRLTITLPSTARVLQKVTFEYKNLDGSIAKKSLEVERSVDWHLPIFVSQNYETAACKQNFIKPKKQKPQHYKKIASLKFVSFYVKDKSLKIVTKDKLLRHFLLVKPHRIVCDFARETDIRSFVRKGVKGSPFERIRVGTHKGYYRVVIRLDGYYEYKVKKTASGYIFSLL